MKRRRVLQAGLALSAAPLLNACGKQAPYQDTGYSGKGVYLSDNFAPVEVETTATALNVTGSIPEELTGRYLRNGPNPINDMDPDSYHWFLGDGMIHGVRLEDGKADWYRNRWIRSNVVSEKLGEATRPVGFGANTNIIGHGGRTWAIVESGTKPVELDYELGTIGNDPGWGGYTAHPKLDPETGDIHALCYDWANYRDHIRYIVMDKNAKEVKNMKVPMQGMSMIHDMSLTENYVVIYDLPVTVSFVALATGDKFPFRWDNDHEPRIGLLPRNGDGKDVIWSPTTPKYAYHPMNAYEDEAGNVVVDICRYERMFEADVHGPFGDSTPRLDRWTINPTTRTVSEDIVNDRNQEFPRCHPMLNSKPYQFGYTLAASGRDFPGIYKYDMKTGNSTMFKFGEGRQGSEAIFIPKEHAKSEDDGYMMSFVYDQNKKTTDLVIVDALDFSRPALASVHLPARVPYGFHGNWLPDADGYKV